MDDLIDKLLEIETLCEEIGSEASDLEHSAEEVEGYAQELKREADVVRHKANDAECLLEEVKQAVREAKAPVQGDPLDRLSLAIVSVVGMTALDRIQYCTPSAARISHNLNSDHWFIGTQVPLCS